MKIKALQNFLQAKKTDFALLYNVGMDVNPNFYYFTQYSGVGCLVIPKNNDPFLIVPEMEFERAKKGTIKNVKKLEKKRFFDSVYENIKGKKEVIGIDTSAFTLAAYKNFRKTFKKCKTLDISQKCRELRIEKTKKESKYLKKSCDCASKILKSCLNNFKDFKKESDVASFLRNETFKQGLELSFPPIIASGKNGSMPHYEPKNVRLNQGLCVLDFGVKYKGYCSDVTRTVGINKISKQEKEKYHKLLQIQESSINKIENGSVCGNIYQSVVDSLGKDAMYFTHGLGHGIGAEIHELPNLTLNSKDKIKNNVFFTIEPGIYYPRRFGIRIEDSIVFDKKPVILTKVTKELIVL